jgi:hypothetical protein
MFGYQHYPSLKKFQDNSRAGGFNDLNGGKDRVMLRLGETYLIAAEAALGVGNTSVAAQMINVLRVRAACDPGPANAPKLCASSHKNDPSILVTPNQITLDFIYVQPQQPRAEAGFAHAAAEGPASTGTTSTRAASARRMHRR